MFSAQDVKERCHGMLSAHVYQKIYDTARSSEGGVIVEIGAAHGAGTVCLAMGLRDASRPGKVYSFEKIIGGSREQFGGLSENEKIIRSNLRHFGVEDRVELIIGDVEDDHHRVPRDRPIEVLVLDADGRIDRDIGLFYDSVRIGGAVIIDDVADMVRVKPTKDGRYSVDQKHRLTFLLLRELIGANMLTKGEAFSGTWFGRKLEASASDLSHKAVLGAYRQLVFGVSRKQPGRLQASVRNALNKISPRLVKLIVRMKNGRRTGAGHGA